MVCLLICGQSGSIQLQKDKVELKKAQKRPKTGNQRYVFMERVRKGTQY